METGKPFLVMIANKGHASTIYHEEVSFSPNSRSSARTTCYSTGPDDESENHHKQTVMDAIEAGATVLDLRTVERSLAIEAVLKGPLLAQGKADVYQPDTGLDGCGYASLSYAPREVFISLWEKRGATVTRP